MISAIEGIIENRNIDSLNMKVGPVSFIVYTSNNTLSQVEIGDKVSLNTHLHVREDNLTLFGFAAIEELKLFQKLITVTGVGPKLALALLSAFNPEKLVSAIVNEDADMISQAPGIGKKIAGRIILDLKNKLEKEGLVGTGIVATRENADVVAALVNLGYSLREATQAASNISSDQETKIEDKIRLALRYLASR